MLDIGNYTLHRQERNCTGRGGLATYTRDLAVERIDYNIPEIEHLALKVDQKDGIFWTDAQTYKDYFEGTTINYNVEAW